MDLRTIQKPLKEKYRSDPSSSRITLKAHSDQIVAAFERAVSRGYANADEAATDKNELG